MVRFTDDVLIAWEEIVNQSRAWSGFKSCASKASNLKLVCEDLGEEVLFLDLEIWIDINHNKFV